MVLTFLLTALMSLGPMSSGNALLSSTNLVEFRSNVGQKLRVDCHGELTDGSVWGTGRYSDDSAVCTAAVHFGILDPERGGTVMVQMMSGTSALVGSKRNGITSMDRTRSEGSFVFVPKNEWTFQPTKTITVKDAISQRIFATWDTRMTDLRGKRGEKMLVTCTAGERTVGPVWGTDVYSDDSAVCLAALHAGVISNKGGDFLVELREGANGYLGTLRNGIQSHSFGGWPSSFAVLRLDGTSPSEPPSQTSPCAFVGVVVKP